MARFVIPLQPIPSQELQVQLSGQSVTLNVYQLQFGLFVDVYSNNALLRGGQIAQNLNRLIREPYLGFTGDLVLLDTQGADDPVYTGLGSRWQLLYSDDGFAANLAA